MPKKKEKAVVLGEIELHLPLKLAQEIHAEAKREGVTVEELVLSVLSATVGHRNGHHQGMVDGAMATLGVMQGLQQEAPKPPAKAKKKNKR